MIQTASPSRTRRIALCFLIGLPLIGVVLGLVILPAITGATCQGGQHIRRVSDAREIYLSIFGTLVMKPADGESENKYFPDSSRFSNSNEYFVYLMQEEVLEEDWVVFSGDVLPQVPVGIDLEDPESVRRFTEGNNFWSVVADVSISDPPETLFIISRNFDEPALRAATNPKDRPNVIDDERFEGMVYYVNLGGRSGFIPIKDLTWERINPAGATNKILHPGPPVPEKSEYE